MPLPTLNDITRDCVVELSDSLTVTFQLQLVSGARYNQIFSDHADHEDRERQVAVELLTEGVDGYYSNEDSNRQPFTDTDACDLWDNWPEWARVKLFRAVVAFSTAGPDADPRNG